MPSELCDERTVSLMVWINAARQSSMTLEHLIACTQLAQWFKFGLTEGNYKHKATGNVRVLDVGSSLTVLSTPSLLDLPNDNNIGPETVDQDALEKALFDQPNPYNLTQTDCVDTTISTSEPGVHHSLTLWAVAEYVRLDSPALEKLLSPPKEDVAAPSGMVEATLQATEMPETEDWDVED
ncbi:hypothetical protein B0H14DRAFT_3721439 [Mycena olivaceomarginata]|nr:hypothetical protein B0H14DRAFT_3721439 [Mycena olivaceomarginata]